VNALLLVVLSQFATDVFDNGTPFEEVENKDGVKVSKRAIKDSVFFENRIELSTPYEPTMICDAVYEWGTKKNDGPGVTLHKLLTDGENVRVVYDQITKPLVSDRDYALTIVRTHFDDGSCGIRFRVTNDAAPPKPEKFVRMDKVWGEWRFVALPKGGSSVSYTLFSDPAGAVPALFVHGAARQAAKEAALQAVEKAKRAAEQKK
jgi:hypothetical protein